MHAYSSCTVLPACQLKASSSSLKPCMPIGVPCTSLSALHAYLPVAQLLQLLIQRVQACTRYTGRSTASSGRALAGDATVRCDCGRVNTDADGCVGVCAGYVESELCR